MNILFKCMTKQRKDANQDKNKDNQGSIMDEMITSLRLKNTHVKRKTKYMLLSDILMDKTMVFIVDRKDQNSWSEDLGIQ